MQSTQYGVPNVQTLTAVLRSLLIENRSYKGQLKVIHRKPIMQGTFPKEIVTCRLDNGRKIRLFCKYAAGHNHNSYGHRGGVVHEIAVYRELLESMQASTPALLGVYTDEAAGEVWLILEYLAGNVRVNKSKDPAAMILAANWIGQFHATTEANLQGTKLTFLEPYDAEYYLGWALRTSQYACNLHQNLHWLELLLERFDEVVTNLLSAPLTVIHGEYYPKNILFGDGKIHPVDWESAAIAAGEIDLASLTDMWPEEIVRKCELEYQRVRWPDGSPHEFQRTLCTAQLYINLRWIGDSPEGAKSLSRLEQLHSVFKKFEMI